MFMNCFASLTDLGGHGGLEPMIYMNTILSEHQDHVKRVRDTTRVTSLSAAPLP